jgi:hypothetical protein
LDAKNYEQRTANETKGAGGRHQRYRACPKIIVFQTLSTVQLNAVLLRF